MKWINTAFKYQVIAETFKKELNEVGIKVGKIFLYDNRYYVPWIPMSMFEYETGVQIANKHIR